jgi:serine/threonine protein kinase
MPLRACSETVLDDRFTLPVNTVLAAGYRIVRVVGSGGFGITYEAEDLNLRAPVAIKEYYPHDFGDRDAAMSVRPRSERHKPTFEWGRSNFLQEARTLARFEHPSVVRVMHVFEENATAYMVMRFERGQNLEAWLNGLGRPPTQSELDSIAAPLLDALQVMHAADFLHRDIAPDNIIVRADGSPVLLDFGAARRAVAQMSRSITGIVKAGYSPHEQYSADSRLQGPWSDLYALGATFYRAVVGRAPEESALRVDEDHMPPAATAAKGIYRPEFLAAIDSCLRVRHSERPRSIAQLRGPLLAQTSQPRPVSQPKPVSQPARSAPRPPSKPVQSRRVTAPQQPSPSRRWLAIGAASLAVLGGAYGGFEYARWQPSAPGASTAESNRLAAEAEARRKVADAAQRQADLDAEKRRQEDAAAAQRRADADAERRATEAAEAAAQRRADLEVEQRRKDDLERIAAEDTARLKAEEDEKRKADERLRVASATLNAEDRATFVKRVQTVLKQGRCYDGAVNGAMNDTQDDLDRYTSNAAKKGKSKPARIELAKATASDFEAWLRDVEDIKGDVCVVKPKPVEREAKAPRQREETAKPRREREETQRARVERPAPEPKESSGSGKMCWGARNNEVAPCRN